MTVRRKALAIIGITLVGVTVVLFVSSQIILAGSFVELEAQNTREHLRRVLNTLTAEVEAMDATAVDWASWDDTYQFVLGQNETFVEDNVTASALTNLQFNL